jgi:predicted nucleic acid-binding protein
MIVISDTSPVTNLLQVQQLDLLQKIFGQVVITPQVYGELCELEPQKEIIDKLNWISINEPHNQTLIADLEKRIDSGEASSIALAVELHADYLLMDEHKGRSEAERLGLKITGIIGILLRAKVDKYIPLVKPILEQLQNEAGFRIHPTLYQKALAIANEE